MKKIYYLIYLITVVLVTACTPEEEDLFNDSSANRADAAIKSNIEILATPSNGWFVEYFPASMQEYGGFNMILSFSKDGTVKVAGEVAADPADVVTSLYTVKQSAGIVLSFDTYNNIFHYFSDPSDPAWASVVGYGLEGDYDFLILEASADKVVLKGKKTGGIAILTPMQDDWSSFISNIQKADEAMYCYMVELQMNGEVIPVSISNRTLTFTYEENGDQKSVMASYVVTETGYKFFEPVVVKGVTLAGFTYDATNKWFAEFTNASIKMVSPALNEQFVACDWYIAYSTLGSFAQPYYAFDKNNYLTPMGEILRYAFIGSSLYGSFGFNFGSYNIADNYTYTGLLGMNCKLIGEDKVSLAFSYTGAGNGVWYHNNAGFDYLLFPFGYSAPRTFTLTRGKGLPAYITLTEDANPSNVIKLYRNQVIDPFNK